VFEVGSNLGKKGISETFRRRNVMKVRIFFFLRMGDSSRKGKFRRQTTEGEEGEVGERREKGSLRGQILRRTDIQDQEGYRSVMGHRALGGKKLLPHKGAHTERTHQKKKR